MLGKENEGGVSEEARKFVMDPMAGASEDPDMIEIEEKISPE